jgi:hypothetical protein
VYYHNGQVIIPHHCGDQCTTMVSNYSSPLLYTIKQLFLIIVATKLFTSFQTFVTTERFTANTHTRQMNDSISSFGTKQITWWPEYAVKQERKRKLLAYSYQAQSEKH